MFIRVPVEDEKLLVCIKKLDDHLKKSGANSVKIALVDEDDIEKYIPLCRKVLKIKTQINQDLNIFNLNLTV
jgi:hypothetical protein